MEKRTHDKQERTKKEVPAIEKMRKKGKTLRAYSQKKKKKPN